MEKNKGRQVTGHAIRYITRVLAVWFFVMGICLNSTGFTGVMLQLQAAETEEQSPKLSSKKITIAKGESYTLSVTGDFDKLSCKSNRKSIATATCKGENTVVVKGVKKGTTTVIATVDGKQLKCTVVVETPKLSKTKLTGVVGDRCKLSVSGTKRKVRFYSNDKTIATVGATTGQVTLRKEGTTTVYAKIGNKKYTCTVTVTAEQEKAAVTPTAVPVEKAEESKLKVHFIDVGQGDATLLECDGEYMLIDAGGNDKGTAIQLYLTKQGVKELKYVVGTHAHEDHIGGMDVVVTKFSCGAVYLPNFDAETATYRDVFDACEYKSIKITEPIPGESITLGGATITFLAPVQDYKDCNNTSIALYLTHGENSFLFTGDAEEAAEEDILAYAKEKKMDLDCDVYQVGHHGSRTSSCEAFLEKINPEYAVISCKEGNEYGHPHAQTLNSLRFAEVQVFRTDEQGTIVVASDKEKLTFNMSPSESWQAGEQSKSDEEPTPEPTQAPEKEESNTRYILNTNTKKFHYADCSSAKQIKDKNRDTYSGTRQELIDMGYDPCGRCNP